MVRLIQHPNPFALSSTCLIMRCAAVTNEEFCTFFRGFGELVEATVMFDRETLKSRGFGFVIFADPAVAQQMVGADGVGRWDMRGKTIEVKPAQPREGTNRRARPKRPQMQHHAPPSPAYPMYYGGYPQPYPMMMSYPDGAYYYPPMPMWEEPVYDPNGYPQPPMNPV